MSESPSTELRSARTQSSVLSETPAALSSGSYLPTRSSYFVMFPNAFIPLVRKESDLALPTITTFYPNLAPSSGPPATYGSLDWILRPSRRKQLVRVTTLFGILGCWFFLARNNGKTVLQAWDDWESLHHAVTTDTTEQQYAEEILDSSENIQHPKPISAAGRVTASSSAEDLLEGLVPLERNAPNPTVHSVLGEEAENAYVYGSRTLKDYVNSLSTFIDVAMPEYLRSELHTSLERYTDNSQPNLYLQDDEDRLPGLGEQAGTRNIWQTDANSEHAESAQVATWKDNGEGWDWKLLNDGDASRYVAKSLKESQLKAVWDLLPSGILHSDMLRYLLLLLEGGIYSDTDTRRLKPISAWGNGARLWNDGRGWLYGNDSGIDLGDGLQGIGNDDLGPPSVVIGIEADVGDRADWHDWWSRPVQVVQWTISSTPYHPIALDVVRHITHQTAEAVTWQNQKPQLIQSLLEAGVTEKAEQVKQATILSEPKEGGPIGVMNWTGPGVWTDAVLRYIRVKFGLRWTDLKDLQEPLRIGEVLILPVTGFSPGVGLFGAKSPFDAQAMVEHLFAGSWKNH